MSVCAVQDEGGVAWAPGHPRPGPASQVEPPHPGRRLAPGLDRGERPGAEAELRGVARPGGEEARARPGWRDQHRL